MALSEHVNTYLNWTETIMKGEEDEALCYRRKDKRKEGENVR